MLTPSIETVAKVKNDLFILSLRQSIVRQIYLRLDAAKKACLSII